MDGNPHIQKAYEAILKHDFEQATEWFEQAIADEPDNASYHYRLSITYARSNKVAKAVEHAERACQLEQSAMHYQLHLNTLIARQMLIKADELLTDVKARRIDEAIAMLREAAKLDPLSVEALLILAVAYERSGRLFDAKQAVQEALQLEPQHQDASELYRHLSRRLSGE